MADADQLHGRAIIAIQDMRDEIERLRAEVASFQGRMEGYRDACKDIAADRQRQETRAEKAERELAELRERIEKAPSIEFERADWVDHMQSVPPDLIGKRVRLVVED